MSQLISHKSLEALLSEQLALGVDVVAPVLVTPGLPLYRHMPPGSADILVRGFSSNGFVRPRNSIKDFLFPRHETLMTYRLSAHDVDLHEAPLPEQPLLVLGAHPCDAAALPILDHVFHWDCTDAAYEQRRALTTVVTLACTTHDDACFCTSVGLGPAAEAGSDALLLPLDDDTYEVRPLTDKGAALFRGKMETSERIAEVPRGPETLVDPEWMRTHAAEHFEDTVWAEISARCLGCGVCAYTCPTCHCFDIVDEGNAAGGCRVRNWDSCQFCLFTEHASGHNPRSKQSQRQRQRVFHKFHIYPERFGAILCTGCGNCGRNCPAGLGMLNTLLELSEAAGMEQP
ncbi:MAG: 4Fe-4S dicluster domain-containing protein [Candidatus Hydrogenedentes bacterium]|nr:4Fe-4S dicluster domain-containing protein [Candidatus Hydrogenedentota bacterium]